MKQKLSATQKKAEQALLTSPKSQAPHSILVGIDNGASGSIAILSPGVAPFWVATPIKKCRNYQKTEKHLNRVDAEVLFNILYDRVYVPMDTGLTALVLLERPYCNPMGFNASMLAARALEATLVIIDLMGLEHQFVDSKQWQNVMLPNGIVGRDELKKASYAVGKELFADVKFKKDADSLLMAEWARRKGL